MHYVQADQFPFLFVATIPDCRVVSIFVGCSDEKNDFFLEEKNNEIVAFSVKNGVLHFSSDSSFVETVNEICEMDEEELSDWEASIGFKSLRTELNLVYKEMDLCEDSISFENLIAYNRIFFRLREMLLFQL